MDSGNDRSAPVTAPGVSPRSNEEIRADLLALLDELFPLDRDDEPNEADLAAGVEWWARTGIWWGRQCRRAWAQRAALLVEREDQDRRWQRDPNFKGETPPLDDDNLAEIEHRAFGYTTLSEVRQLAGWDVPYLVGAVRDLRAKVAAVEAALAEALNAAQSHAAVVDLTANDAVIERSADNLVTTIAALAAASPGDEETT